ncbi:acyltransferase [Polymorphobacter glacialis]|uniref:Acyltransferase n=1 Tax=Sandarakinorhabdus glacialis TaxID=1614636 RepID=A0A917E998_9SPHN|nr:acyltransferase [Polymorphobacter glacialis]
MLDSLRGVCAILVVLYHYPNGSHLTSSEFIRGGYLFVDFFFVLSGFVIAYSYANRITDRESLLVFVARRFFRLWPLHLFILALYFLVEVSMKPAGAELGAVSGRNLPDLWRSLTLTNGFAMDHTSPWNMPSWSISAEWWTYIAFALLVLALPRRLWAGLVAMVAVALAALMATHSSMRITFDMGLVRCLVGFGLGALMATQWKSVSNWLGSVGTRKLAISEVLLVVAVTVFVASARLSHWSFLAPFLFSAALAVFAMEAGPVSRLMRGPFFVRAGVLSYSIYMVHQLIMGRLRNVTDLGGRLGYTPDPANKWHMDAMVVLMVVMVWVVAALTYRFVEMPGQAMGSTVIDRFRRVSRKA